MATHTPYLKDAKQHILASLRSVRGGRFVEHSDFEIPMDDLEGDALNTAIHIKAGFQGLFEGVIFDNSATVKVDGVAVAESDVVYRVGQDKDAADEYQYVHKIVVSNGGHPVFETCWLDSAE